jgi:cytochrome b involved in lipid metabolism
MNKSFLLIPLIALILGLGYIRMQAKAPSVPVAPVPMLTQAVSQPSDAPTLGSKQMSLATIAIHGKEGDCWTAIDGIVYDISSFTSDHPGGPVILQVCGKDGSELFHGPHGEREKKRVTSMKIGTLEKN